MAVDNVKFKIEVNSGNAAVVENPNAAVLLALAQVMNGLRDGDSGGALRDDNGNTVGHWSLLLESDEDAPVTEDEEPECGGIRTSPAPFVISNPAGEYVQFADTEAEARDFVAACNVDEPTGSGWAYGRWIEHAGHYEF